MSEPKKCKLKGRVADDSDAMAILKEYLERPSFRHLTLASIHLYWHADWEPDQDGVCTGAKICKPTELMQVLAEEADETIDFAILLPRDSWPMLEEQEKRRRIFHELLHAMPSIDAKTGEQKMDEQGRLQWRIRKHDNWYFNEELKEFGPDAIIRVPDAIRDGVRHGQRPMEKPFDRAEIDAARWVRITKPVEEAPDLVVGAVYRIDEEELAEAIKRGEAIGTMLPIVVEDDGKESKTLWVDGDECELAEQAAVAATE